MRTVAGFIILLNAAVSGICAAQTIVAPPQILFTAPRAAFKRLPISPAAAAFPAASSAPSSAPLPATAGVEVGEVTVTGHRPISVSEGAHFYVETRIPDPLSANMAIANGRVCADGSLPLQKRISSCDMAIWMTTHSTSMARTELSKVYVARAVAYQQNGDDQPAIKDFDTAHHLDPANARPWIGLGNLYAARSDYVRALENYDRAMNIEPDDPVVYNNRGTALECLGRHDEAIADFSRAISIDPQDTAAHANRATAYLSSKRADLAIADLDEVIRADPANGLAYYDRGTAYELNGEIDKAIADYRTAVHKRPSYAPASAALGRLDARRNPDSALDYLTTAIRLDPKSPALRSRALLYLSLNRPERALPDLDQVIANDASDAIAWANRAVAKSQLGNFAGAIVDCTRAIELAPTVVNHINRGNAYGILHRNEEALADFEVALQAQPRSVPALIGRANANYAMRRLKASLDDYTRVIDADPQSAIAYFKRGNIQLDLREFGAAFGDYSESLRLDPNQAVVLLNRSIAAARLGHRSDAANDQRRALALDPSILDGKPYAREHETSQ